MHDFYSTAAQVLPVLFLAIVFELRTLSGRGPNVYQALGIPVQLPGAPRWFWRSYSTILVLVPATMFVGEAAALFVLSGHGPTHASCYWTAGALVIGGLTVVIPFFRPRLEGLVLSG